MPNTFFCVFGINYPSDYFLTYLLRSFNINHSYYIYPYKYENENYRIEII